MNNQSPDKRIDPIPPNDDPQPPPQDDPILENDETIHYISQSQPHLEQDIDPSLLSNDNTGSISSEGNTLEVIVRPTHPIKTVHIHTTNDETEMDVLVNNDNDKLHPNMMVPPSPQKQNISESNDDDSDDSAQANSNTEENKLLLFLKSAKKENHNMTFRRNLIMSFCPSKNKIRPSQFFHESLKHNPIIDYLVRFYRKSLSYRENAWRVDECADILHRLWILVQLQDEVNRDTHQPPKDCRPVQKLREFIKPCLERIATDEDNNSRIKKKRNQFKVGNSSTQESIISKEGSKWTSRVEPHPCPKCQHCNVVPVVTVESLILEFSKLESEYKQEMDEYARNVKDASFCKNGKRRQKVAKKYDEPKKPSFPKQTMACMCCLTKCRNIVDGRGCHHCHSLTKNGIQIPFNITKAECECALCQCTCSIEFAKTSWQTIAASIEHEKLLEDNEARSKKMFCSDKDGKFLSCFIKF